MTYSAMYIYAGNTNSQP